MRFTRRLPAFVRYIPSARNSEKKPDLLSAGVTKNLAPRSLMNPFKHDKCSRWLNFPIPGHRWRMGFHDWRLDIPRSSRATQYCNNSLRVEYCHATTSFVSLTYKVKYQCKQSVTFPRKASKNAFGSRPSSSFSSWTNFGSSSSTESPSFENLLEEVRGGSRSSTGCRTNPENDDIIAERAAPLTREKFSNTFTLYIGF